MPETIGMPDKIEVADTKLSTETLGKPGTHHPRLRFIPSVKKPDELFYGCRGHPQPMFLIVGESWGNEEKTMQLPFMGASGELLERLLLEAGIQLHECLFTNVVSEKPAGNNMQNFFHPTAVAKKLNRMDNRGLYPRSNVRRGVDSLHRLIKATRPDLIIALGNYVLWALTQDDFSIIRDDETGRLIPSGISDYRGSQLYSNIVSGAQNTPLLPTYHPAATFRTYAWQGMIRHDLNMRVNKYHDWNEPPYNFVINPSYETVIHILESILWVANEKSHCPYKLAVDIETRNGFIACLGISWDKREAICIPFMTTDYNKKEGPWSEEELFNISRLLRQLFTHRRIRIVGQNFLYDAQYIFNQFFVIPKISDDTMLKHHCLFPGGGNPEKGVGPQGLVQKSLNHISSLYNDHHRYWKSEGKNWDVKLPEEQLWKYNCKDCCATYEADEHLTALILKENQTEQYRFQIDQVNHLALPMMLQGIRIDLNARAKMAFDLQSAIAEFETKLEPMVPEELLPPRKKGQAPWYKSPKQLMHLFYTELGIKPVIGPKGRPTTGKKALPIIAKREPMVKPIVDAISTLRSLGVFYGNFIGAELDTDNRMRCSFNPAGTETFRWNSGKNAYDRGTNLQNIPSGDEESQAEEKRRTRGVAFPNVRKIFIPDAGYLLIDADLSGADAQVVAWESDEQEWKDLLRSGGKLHKVISEEMVGTSEQPHYDMFKRRIHATNYGGSASTIHETLLGMYGADHTSLAFERDFQDYWFSRFPGIKAWHERVKESLRKNRGVSNRFGNRVIFQDRIDSCFPNALAWIPQSTVALVCNRGALAVVKKYPFVELLLQVHDSIVFQVPLKHRNRLNEIKQTLNEITVPYDDPLRIPWGVKTSTKSWGDCK